MKHSGQESGGELCEIFKFSSFLQSKSVNNTKLRQLKSPSPLTGVSHLNPLGAFCPPRPLGYTSVFDSPIAFSCSPIL